MLNADKVPYFYTCPRCGVDGLETLKTHAFCVNCNYEAIFNDGLYVIPRWALDAVKEDSKPEACDQKPNEKAAKVILRRPIKAKSDGSAA